MARLSSSLALAFLLLMALPLPGADTPARPVVPAFERFAKDPIAAGGLGLVLLGELNCTSCHAAEGVTQGLLTPKLAPVLDKVGSRVQPEYLQAFLENPHEKKPGSTMPELFAGLSPQEKKEAVLALTHYLASQGGPPVNSPIEVKQIATGRTLFAQSGCLACHNPRDAAGKESQKIPGSVPLGPLENKYTFTSLSSFLENPHQVRPSGRMPAVLKDNKETKAVASYLLQGAKGALQAKALKFKSFEGTWDKLPDFAKLKPVNQGFSPGFDVEAASRENNSALRFEGWFKLPAAGTYTFHLGSDDGSKLWIDGKLVIDNDGVHPHQSVTKSVELFKGEHQVVVGVFNGGGEFSLNVEIEGKRMDRQALSGLCQPGEKSAEASAEPIKEKEKAVEGYRPDAQLAEKGKALFASAGCANCHSLTNGNKKVVGTVKGPALLKMRPGQGCLAEKPLGKAPDFSLDDQQRKSIASALQKLASNPAMPSASQQVNHTFLSLNCYACHQRDKVGGTEESRLSFFLSNQPEMGDEGRVPPHLTGVGAKLNEAWLKQVLDQGTKARPYMFTRMPKYGSGNVNHLVKGLAQSDPLPAVDPITFADPASKVRSSARFLVGSKALGCIKCHTFNNQKAEGIQAMDLTTMPQRLKHDWFQRYMLDPQVFRAGTRMPAPWPMGKTFFNDVLEGSTLKQIEGIYVYLSAGSKASAPEGLTRDAIPLVPGKEPIIYRNFIEGAGARAIGVGYPEKVNLAFDANHLRLALIWQGGFIDAGKHWRDRGVGFQAPLGDNVVSLPAGPNLAVLAGLKDAWPNPVREQAGQFLGYEIDALGRPAFQYRVGDVAVNDSLIPSTNKEGGFTRTLSLSCVKPPSAFYLRAAVGNKIEELKDGWFSVDGEIKVRVQGALVREMNGKKELLAPVLFEKGQAKLVQEFSW